MGSDYNFYGLVGLILVKIVFLIAFIMYCCKKSRDITSDLQEKGESKDLPPSYSDLMDNKNPPIYIESVLNEEINPELNKAWATDLQNMSVKPEVADVIQRSRTNSCVSASNDQQSQRSSPRISLHHEAFFFPRSII